MSEANKLLEQLACELKPLVPLKENGWIDIHVRIPMNGARVDQSMMSQHLDQARQAYKKMLQDGTARLATPEEIEEGCAWRWEGVDPSLRSIGEVGALSCFSEKFMQRQFIEDTKEASM